MTNALFLSSRSLDRAVMSSSSAQGLLTANNVQTIRPDQVWRATGCAAEWLAWDFGEAVEVEACAILAHNFGPAARIRVRLAANASDVTAAPAVDTGLVSAWPSSGKTTDPDWPSYFSLLLFVVDDSGGVLLSETGDPLLDEFGAPLLAEEPGPVAPLRYGRLDIVDPTNPDGFVQVGRLFAGPAFVPTDNIDIDITLGLVSPGEVTRSPFGHTFTDDRGPASRVMNIPFSALDETELTDELFELERYCGVARDFAFCVDPSATSKFHKFAMQARFDPPQTKQARPYFDTNGEKVWQSTLILSEVL